MGFISHGANSLPKQVKIVVCQPIQNRAAGAKPFLQHAQKRKLFFRKVRQKNISCKRSSGGRNAARQGTQHAAGVLLIGFNPFFPRKMCRDPPPAG